jgi:DNA-binding GntR family transcriptional regulator
MEHTNNTLTVNETTYRALREKILFGEMLPGRAFTLRGLAETLGVSPTPVRETVRRLTAERALSLKDNRRVSIPDMTAKRFQEIRHARLILEPELATLAMINIDSKIIKKLINIDKKTDIALVEGDLEGYMRGNYDFHFTIYRLAHNKVLLSLVESLWLQFGPYMRLVYNRLGTDSLDDQHRVATKALEDNDCIGFKNAIMEDLQQGMTFIGASKTLL